MMMTHTHRLTHADIQTDTVCGCLQVGLY